MNVVLTGTSRGIGRALLERAAGRGDRVLAIARDPASLGEFGSKVEKLALDVTAPDAGETLARALEAWPSVDVLVNVAGVYRDSTSTADFLESFHVNAVTPFQITRATLPWLRKSQSPRAAHLTSKMGSITDNTSGGAYAYRASKSALNMINRSLAVDQDWLTTVVLHPGWVQTDMGGTRAPTSVEASAEGLWRVIDGLRPENSGEFYDFRGEVIPW